jgi:hypothetical protein
MPVPTKVLVDSSASGDPRYFIAALAKISTPRGMASSSKSKWGLWWGYSNPLSLIGRAQEKVAARHFPQKECSIFPTHGLFSYEDVLPANCRE